MSLDQRTVCSCSLLGQNWHVDLLTLYGDLDKLDTDLKFHCNYTNEMFDGSLKDYIRCPLFVVTCKP